MSWSRRFLACAAVSVCVTGCGKKLSDDPQSTLDQIFKVKAQVLSETATMQTYQAADLLTDEEIREITGMAVVEKKPGPAHGIFSNGCEWKLGSGAWTITLGVMGPGGRKYFDKYLNLDGYNPLGEKRAIPGLGDVAHSKMKGCITAVKGDTLVDLQYISFKKSESEVAQKLVEKILSRVQ